MPIPVSEIVDGFENRNCVLLLGPGLSRDKNAGELHRGLIDYFKLKQLEIEEDMDNLYSCNQQTRTRAVGYLKEYYLDNGEPNELHRQLARIPCHLYVSINPANFMKQALEEYGVEHEFKYYIKDKPSEEVAIPTAEKPLVYNLFGSIDDPQSLILTHDDLIRFLFSIIQEFKPPQNLRSAVKDAAYFVFLGFEFDKWYLKLLLKMISVEKGKVSIATEGKAATPAILRTYFKSNYDLEFVEDNLDQYVKSLFEECEKRGLLRAIKSKVETSIREEISELIKKDELEVAIDRLYEFSENAGEEVLTVKGLEKQELLDELDGLSARFSRNAKKMRGGVISEEEAGIEENKIIEALQAITQNLEG